MPPRLMIVSVRIHSEAWQNVVGLLRTWEADIRIFHWLVHLEFPLAKMVAKNMWQPLCQWSKRCERICHRQHIAQAIRVSNRNCQDVRSPWVSAASQSCQTHVIFKDVQTGSCAVPTKRKTSFQEFLWTTFPSWGLNLARTYEPECESQAMSACTLFWISP